MPDKILIIIFFFFHYRNGLLSFQDEELARETCTRFETSCTPLSPQVYGMQLAKKLIFFLQAWHITFSLMVHQATSTLRIRLHISTPNFMQRQQFSFFAINAFHKLLPAGVHT